MSHETNWSKVGKRSRRKGKRFEQQISRFLSECTAAIFTSTRNSGRTDLPGDVYCVDERYEDKFVHECKHRESMSAHHMLMGNKAYSDEMDKVEYDFASRGQKYEGLIIWRKDEIGLWVYMTMYGTEEGVPEGIMEQIFSLGQIASDPKGRVWYRVIGIKKNAKLVLLEKTT